ncbi:type I-E CRISPR-associated protein Cas6/Cse3/CasE [Dethiosulfatarculus sandiegensis]|uniref:CRISPR-associated protein Cse3 n=1 Tax=Dethiosulfatarculus sandiegensis TaxID=1429043 RepID=A0A0D2IXR3_9BACT|nr:type I-E CRISPR-associated protein Cas6/Cse3/CasE [Dethiosulfatarculus sandiegensis]KIX10839.1 CRISPR-associated protein Cse3 [Dethiosulfatarculus sandiegensis]
MYISKLTFNPKALETPDFWQLAMGHGELDHKVIWQVFSDSPERKRDFLFRRMQQTGNIPQYLAISDRAPLQNPLWNIQTKPYEPRLSKGTKLGFTMRINPVVKRRDANGKQTRHDLVMDQKQKLKTAGVARDSWPMQAELVQKAGVGWLENRAEPNGFSFAKDKIRAEGYHQKRFFKGRRPVSLSSLDLSGELLITDEELFLKTLYQGLGPAKGYGFGLVLVRPL